MEAALGFVAVLVFYAVNKILTGELSCKQTGLVFHTVLKALDRGPNISLGSGKLSVNNSTEPHLIWRSVCESQRPPL